MEIRFIFGFVNKEFQSVNQYINQSIIKKVSKNRVSDIAHIFVRVRVHVCVCVCHGLYTITWLFSTKQQYH